MKRVFVCSPYAGDIEGNTKMAIEYCKNEIELRNAPFAPHLIYPQMLDENIIPDRELGIGMGLMFLLACDEVHVYGDKITAGMEKEIRFAINNKVDVLFIKQNKREEV